jgi:ABC-type transport system involved in multi-copper enzyme maturation permease subunit
MTKTLALLLDSYRELNAKRLFWVVLFLSAGVVALFAMVGQNSSHITFLWWESPIPAMESPAALYKWMFSILGVKWWLSVGATSLALISTAGTFPDLMASGSIDLYLSKPISRLRLFATKYVGGLLFAALQVLVFSVAIFFLLGIRGHSWEPSVFLSIPIVLAVFSYLFCVCVLLGVMTRSTITSLLIVFLLWFCLWGVQFAEFIILNFKVANDVHVVSLDKRISTLQSALDQLPKTTGSTTEPSVSVELPGQAHHRGFFFHDNSQKVTRTQLESIIDRLQAERSASVGLGSRAEAVAFTALTILPKTDATTDLMVHRLNQELKLPAGDDDNQNAAQIVPPDRDASEFIDPQLVKAEVDHVRRQRTATWVLGTSFTFEAVVVALAAWLFCRRDY